MQRRPLAAAVLVTLAALGAHAPGLVNGYVWDDPDIVLGAYQGDRPRSWTELLLAPDANASDLLAFLVLRRLVDPRVALGAALLFAVHPVQAGTVNELAARNTVLAAALALGALLAHLASRERGGRWRVVACGACYFLGLVSKETAAPIAIVAAFLDWAAPPPTVRPWKTRLAGLAPFAVALAAYLPLRVLALGALAPPAERSAPLAERLLQQLWIVPQYFATAAWPAGLDAARRVPATALSEPWLVPAWLAILAAVAWILWRGTRATRLGLLLFAASYLPVSGLIAIPSSPIAERHVYLAALGLWLVVADRLVALASVPKLRRVALPAGIAMLLVLAGLSARRATDFRDDLSTRTTPWRWSATGTRSTRPATSPARRRRGRTRSRRTRRTGPPGTSSETSPSGVATFPPRSAPSPARRRSVRTSSITSTTMPSRSRRSAAARRRAPSSPGRGRSSLPIAPHWQPRSTRGSRRLVDAPRAGS